MADTGQLRGGNAYHGGSEKHWQSKMVIQSIKKCISWLISNSLRRFRLVLESTASLSYTAETLFMLEDQKGGSVWTNGQRKRERRISVQPIIGQIIKKKN